MALQRDQDEERAARIDMLLEELRLNTEDMRELAKQALERARASQQTSRLAVSGARRRQAQRHAVKKR